LARAGLAWTPERRKCAESVQKVCKKCAKSVRTLFAHFLDQAKSVRAPVRTLLECAESVRAPAGTLTKVCASACAFSGSSKKCAESVRTLFAHFLDQAKSVQKVCKKCAKSVPKMRERKKTLQKRQKTLISCRFSKIFT
jgi:hypothetical protein